MLHGLAVDVARHPEIVGFARRLLRAAPAGGRLGRIAALLTFAGALVDSRTGHGERNGLDVLLDVLGRDHGPAVVLGALLMAAGERARVECTREMAFVQVELEAADLFALPPFARLHVRRGRTFLPLDARRGRTPLGFLPRPVREALSRRRALLALAGGSAA